MAKQAKAQAVQRRKDLPEIDRKVLVEARISMTCDEVKRLLIEKNRSYGSTALHPRKIFARGNAVELLEARIDDKLNRIANNPGAYGEDPILDLLGYLVLLRIAKADQLAPVKLLHTLGILPAGKGSAKP